MSRLYLITGFLGAGKTTFLKNFILLFTGQRIQLIVNEFGKEGVDGSLLSDLCTYLREISGGSLFCSCRINHFEKVLQESATEKPDVILVEASGLSDPTGVRRLFAQAGRFPHISYQGAICLVDTVRFPKLYATARSCTRQLAVSDVALVNKVDLAQESQRVETLTLIHNQRPDMPVLETSFGRVPPDFLELLHAAQKGKRENLPLVEDLSSKRITLKIFKTISVYELEMFIQMFAEQTFRVKGFIETADQGIVLVDCVGTAVSVTSYAGNVPKEALGILTILSGAKMPVRSAVTSACKWYRQYILASEL